MDIIITLLTGLCLIIGGFLCLSGGVGVLRFPDFYSRMHAAGVTDTLGAGFILIALMMQAPNFLVVAKLIMIFLLTLLVGSTTSHVLAKAAWRNGLRPQVVQNESSSNSETNGGQSSKQ